MQCGFFFTKIKIIVMKIFDISLTYAPNSVTSRTEKFFDLKRVKSISENQVNISKITLGSHSGTHIDAPLHYVESGKDSSQIDIRKFIGPCQVLEVKPKNNLIERDDIVNKIKSKRILFKTTNSELLEKPFTSDYISIGLTAAQYLTGNKVELVGIDYFSCVAKGTLSIQIHNVLLRSDVVIVEGINLSKVKPGNYDIFVGALKIGNSDGAPARIFLVQK